MIIRAHGNGHAVHLEGHAVVEHIADDIHILTPHGLGNDPLSFARSKPGAVGMNQVGILRPVASPLTQVAVYLFGKGLTPLHPDNAQLRIQ